MEFLMTFSVVYPIIIHVCVENRIDYMMRLVDFLNESLDQKHSESINEYVSSGGSRIIQTGITKDVLANGKADQIKNLLDKAGYTENIDLKNKWMGEKVDKPIDCTIPQYWIEPDPLVDGYSMYVYPGNKNSKYAMFVMVHNRKNTGEKPYYHVKYREVSVRKKDGTLYNMVNTPSGSWTVGGGRALIDAADELKELIA